MGRRAQAGREILSLCLSRLEPRDGIFILEDVTGPVMHPQMIPCISAVFFTIGTVRERWSERVFSIVPRWSKICNLFLDASTYLYKRLCPSVGPSVGWLVGWSRFRQIR